MIGQRHRSRVTAIAVLAALPLLSGCVAAAAIPVLAAGTMATTRGGKVPSPLENAAEPRVSIPGDDPAAPRLADAPSAVASAPGAIVRSQTFPDGSTVEVSMPLRGKASPSASSSPMSVDTGTTVDLADGTRLSVIQGPLPAPTTLGPTGRDASNYAALGRFAAERGTAPVVGNDRQSAMLADPGTLNPARRECSVQPAAVLVDLDPAGATLDPGRPLEADPAFATVLAGLRSRDVAIAWVSSLTADRAGAVRKALVSSGLDPSGRDQLVLVRFAEERKQTRRQDVAKELCVVAIAGDERADFDELFQYLKRPDGATALEAMFGDGWFIVPTPLT